MVGCAIREFMCVTINGNKSRCRKHKGDLLEFLMGLFVNWQRHVAKERKLAFSEKY